MEYHTQMKKESTIYTHYNLDESHRYCVEHKKVGTKKYILYDPIYMKVENRQN